MHTYMYDYVHYVRFCVCTYVTHKTLIMISVNSCESYQDRSYCIIHAVLFSCASSYQSNNDNFILVNNNTSHLYVLYSKYGI